MLQIQLACQSATSTTNTTTGRRIFLDHTVLSRRKFDDSGMQTPGLRSIDRGFTPAIHSCKRRKISKGSQRTSTTPSSSSGLFSADQTPNFFAAAHGGWQPSPGKKVIPHLINGTFASSLHNQPTAGQGMTQLKQSNNGGPPWRSFPVSYGSEQPSRPMSPQTQILGNIGHSSFHMRPARHSHVAKPWLQSHLQQNAAIAGGTNPIDSHVQHCDADGGTERSADAWWEFLRALDYNDEIYSNGECTPLIPGDIEMLTRLL